MITLTAIILTILGIILLAKGEAEKITTINRVGGWMLFFAAACWLALLIGAMWHGIVWLMVNAP